MPNRSLLIVFVFLCLNATFGQASTKHGRYVIGTSNESTLKIAKPIIDNAYRSIGVYPEYEHLPNARLQVLMEQGLIDADIARLDTVFDGNAAYIKVPVPLRGVRFELFCGHHIPTCHNGLLNDGSMTIAVARGFSMNRILMRDKKVTVVEHIHADNNLDMLKNGRVDLIIGLRLSSGELLFASDAFQSSPQPVFQGDAFHYVSAKNAHLVEQLIPAIQKQLALEKRP